MLSHNKLNDVSILFMVIYEIGIRVSVSVSAVEFLLLILDISLKEQQQFPQCLAQSCELDAVVEIRTRPTPRS